MGNDEITNGEPTPLSVNSADPISLYHELRWLLMAGTILFSTGVGGLVYESRGDLAHFIALGCVAAISAACYIYAAKHKSHFSPFRVEEKSTFFSFIVLLGALTMLTAVAYLQFRFNLFGDKFGLATFIPMIILFSTAYYFDHEGVLGMAITNLAAWAGLVVTQRAFGVITIVMSPKLIITGLTLTVLLELCALLSEKRKFKSHFSTVYRWAALHLCFISVLTGLFNFIFWPWLILLIISTYYYYFQAVKERSFGRLLCIGIYVFIGLGYLFIRLLEFLPVSGMFPVYLGIFYFIGSSILFASFLMKQNKTLKDDHLQ